MATQEKIDEENRIRSAEEQSGDEQTKAVMPPADVVVFNEMRSCSDLFRMYKKNVLDIRPDFQRGIVWKNKEKSLFVDSLIKQLPIPSICISWDASTGKRMVIDGLQRIWTIVSFLDYETSDWKISKTDGVDQRLSGLSISRIHKEFPRLFQILEECTLPVNVIRCDYRKSNHMEYLFQIFSRLNSGGRRLLYQEIRNCVYQGSLNSFLKDYVHGEKWLKFVNIVSGDVDKYRFGNEERVLRFMAFYEGWEKYNSSLVQFLNKYMETNREMSEAKVLEFRAMLDEAITVFMRIKGRKDVRKNWNLVECVLIGIATNLKHVKSLDAEALTVHYAHLISADAYGEKMREGVMHGPKVKERIKLAVEEFRR